MLAQFDSPSPSMDPLLILALVAIVILIVCLVSAVQKYAAVEREMSRLVEQRFQEWRNRELAQAQGQATELARREAANQLDTWKMSYETSIRQDAICRSQAVIVGKVSEHLVPFMGSVFPYNPKDARFIGSPIDILVFDGLDAGQLRDILFLEVKTSSSALTPKQRQIREAISAGRVKWREVRI
jgi:predicted Holliday junction resolvase-like endonuclease